MIPEVFNSILQVSPLTLKRFLVSSCKKAADKPFLAEFCQEIVKSTEISSIQLMGEFLRSLMEGDDDSDPDLLYEVLYDTVLSEFMKIFTITDLESFSTSIIEILSILNQCIRSHNCRIRYFLIFHEVIQKVVSLIDYPNNPLKIAILKFLRTVILKNDKFLNRFIITHNCFAKVIEVYVENGEKENMIFSSVLSLIQAVHFTSSQSLIEHIVTKHIPTIENVNIRRHFDILTEISNSNLTDSLGNPKFVLVNSTELVADEEFSSESNFESDEEDIFEPGKRKHVENGDLVYKKTKTESSGEFMT